MALRNQRWSFALLMVGLGVAIALAGYQTPVWAFTMLFAIVAGVSQTATA